MHDGEGVKKRSGVKCLLFSDVEGSRWAAQSRVESPEAREGGVSRVQRKRWDGTYENENTPFDSFLTIVKMTLVVSPFWPANRLHNNPRRRFGIELRVHPRATPT